MADAPLSQDLVHFIGSHVDSVFRLDVLLLLEKRRPAALSAEEVGDELRYPPDAALRELVALNDQHLVVEEGGDPPRFRFCPQGAEDARRVDELASTYAIRPTTVIGTIHVGPNRGVRSLADAFRRRTKR